MRGPPAPHPPEGCAPEDVSRGRRMARSHPGPHHASVSLECDEGMTVGVESLDAEHRQVRRHLRHLASAAREGREDEVRAALRHLQADLAGRHAEEERWIAEVGYPGEREHARAHRALLGRIAATRDGDVRSLFAAAGEVISALDAHLRFDDLKLGRFWTARQNLRKLAENGPGAGASLTPIPGSPGVAPPQPLPVARWRPPPRPASPPDAAAATPPPASRRGR